jgi:hypothetical protein
MGSAAARSGCQLRMEPEKSQPMPVERCFEINKVAT